MSACVDITESECLISKVNLGNSLREQGALKSRGCVLATGIFKYERNRDGPFKTPARTLRLGLASNEFPVFLTKTYDGSFNLGAALRCDVRVAINYCWSPPTVAKRVV